MLTSMANGKCSFTKTSNFVNSFMETWIFYQITVQDWIENNLVEYGRIKLKIKYLLSRDPWYISQYHD